MTREVQRNAPKRNETSPSSRQLRRHRQAEERRRQRRCDRHMKRLLKPAPTAAPSAARSGQMSGSALSRLGRSFAQAAKHLKSALTTMNDLSLGKNAKPVGTLPVSRQGRAQMSSKDR